MSRADNNLGFGHGVVIAFAIAAPSALVFSAAALLGPTEGVLKVLLALGAGSYLGAMFYRKKLRFGRLVLPLAWLLAAGVIQVTSSSLSGFVIAHVAAMWFTRTLICHASLLSALIDLGLSALAYCTAIASFWHSGSFGLSVWCFYLVSALHAFIPSRWDRSEANSNVSPLADFTLAYEQAQAALRRLTNV